MEVDKFLEDFISKRTEVHQRKVKSEKLLELLQSGSQNTGVNIPASEFNQLGSSAVQTPYTPSWNLPYPTGSAAMPDVRNYLPQ